MENFSLKKFVQVRREDKKPIGFQLVYNNGYVVSFGEQSGASVSEAVLTSDPRYIEIKSMHQGGKSFIKISYLGKDEAMIDSFLLYLPQVEEWQGKRLLLLSEDEHIVGF